MRFCSHCGAQLSPQNKFCPSCGAAAPASSGARDEQPTQAVPSHAPTHEQPTQAVPGHGSSDEETRAVPSSGGPAYTSNAPHASHSSNDDATRAAGTSSADWSSEYASSGGHASGRQYDSSSHTSSSHTPGQPIGAGHASQAAGDVNGYSSAPYQREQVAPMPPASPVTLSDGGRSSGSGIGRILAAAAAVVVLGGGAAFAYGTMKGDDSKTSSSSASQPGSPASGGSTAAGAAPVASADSKPKTMPDLKGKSIEEAQGLLSPAVKIETTKTNLMEGMSGGATISAQETAAGQATPDTVKVTLDQPANVTYVDTDSSLVVDSNPFSTNDAQVAQHSYKHYDSREMYWSDNNDPQLLKLNLNRAYSRLRTDVAIDSTAKDQNKTFTVIVRKDGTQVWNQSIKFGEQPKQIDLDMTNALRVEIEVSIVGGTSDNQGESSKIVFGDLRVLAEPGKGNSSPSPSS